VRLFTRSFQSLRPENSLATVAIAIALLYFAGGMVIAFVTLWLYKLGASFVDVGIVGAFYDFALALSFLVGGILSDRYGGRFILLLSLVCSLASAIMYGIAGFLLVWIPVALGLVIGKAAMGLRQTSSFSIVSKVAHSRRKATSFGFVYTLQQLGYVIGPIIGGVMIVHYGWSSPFIVTIPIILVAIFLIISKLDVGQVTSARVSLSLANVRESIAMDRGIMALIIVAIWDQFFQELSNPFFMIFLENEFQATPYIMGLCFTAMSIATLLFGIPGGLSSDVTGKRKIFIVLGAVMMSVSMALVAFAFDQWMFVASYFLAGISFTIANTTIPSYFADATGCQLSTAYGVRLGMMYFAGMFAPPIGGWLIQTYHSIRLPFIISLVASTIEIGLILLLFREGAGAHSVPKVSESPLQLES
jgi:MFS family permease